MFVPWCDSIEDSYVGYGNTVESMRLVVQTITYLDYLMFVPWRDSIEDSYVGYGMLEVGGVHIVYLIPG